MAETLAQIQASLNKARGAWMALIAIGTLLGTALFSLSVYIASENADRIKQIREAMTDHEARIGRLEGAAKEAAKHDKETKP